MSKKFYRTLKVNGEEYHFNVGKQYIKIKGPEGSSNITKTDFFKDYRGSNGDKVYKYAVSPGMVADYINGKKIRDINLKLAVPQCNCTRPLSEKRWRCDPFDAEIYEEYRYAMWCDDCFEERSWDI